MVRFHVTYETVTPESAEEGDAADRGYVHPNGGRDTLDRVEDLNDYAFDLRGAVRQVSSSVWDCGRWFEATWTDTNFHTGAETRYSLHPPRNITPASYNRLSRLLGAIR
jgi:hypothetical protein